MMEWIARAVRNPHARVTGVVYLLYFLTAILAEFLVGRKLVAYGIATNLIATAFYVVLTLLFYGMFKPVNKSLSLLAALFSLAGCAVMSLGLFPHASLPISPLLFFGPYCLLIGYLIFRSTFLPRILGVLMALAGLGWLAFFVPQPRTFSDPRDRRPRHVRGGVADAMAHRDARERSGMERAGQRNGKTAVCRRCGAGAWPSRSGLIRMRLTQSLA
jgi:hypothetical protein